VALLLHVRDDMSHTLVEEAEEPEEELDDIEDAGGHGDADDGDGERGTRALEPHVRRAAVAAPQDDGAAAQLEDARQARRGKLRRAAAVRACRTLTAGDVCARRRACPAARASGSRPSAARTTRATASTWRVRIQRRKPRLHCTHRTHSYARATHAGQLQAYGYALVDDASSADLWLINTCTVKSPSQSAMDTLLSSGRAANKALLVAGCVPQGDRNAAALAGLSLLGVTQIDRVVEAASETLKGNTVRLLGKKALPALDLPKLRRNAHVEIVPLSTGCLGSCTYCKTVHARGKLGSYAPEALRARVAAAVASGVTEIWLSSEDTGAYGRDLGTDLAALLADILPLLPPDGRTMLRLVRGTAACVMLLMFCTVADGRGAAAHGAAGRDCHCC
jgi:hypothetical protein